MRWKIPTEPPCGTARTRWRFAWAPVQIDGYTVWLGWYREAAVYCRRKVPGEWHVVGLSLDWGFSLPDRSCAHRCGLIMLSPPSPPPTGSAVRRAAPELCRWDGRGSRPPRRPGCAACEAAT